MSKKTEREAQIRKARLAQPLQSQRKVEGLGPSAASREEERREPRKPLPRWLFWTLVGVSPFVVLACLSGLVSMILAPEVLPYPFATRITPSIQIVNKSFLPLKDFQYTCELASVTDQSGFSVADPAPGTGEKHRSASLARGERVALDCQQHLDPQGLRIQSAESKVTISYWHPGWPLKRHTEYRVQGEFDPRGSLIRWRVN